MVKASQTPVLSMVRWLFMLSLFASASWTTAAYEFATDDERNTIEIFERSRPSVVFVTNQQLVRNPGTLDLVTVPRGSGTGFVWDEQGYIVTNFHVLEGARKIQITLQDQSTWSAKIVGLAPERDLA